MNENAANDEANTDASGTSSSRGLGTDGDDGEEFRHVHSQSRSLIRDDADANALGDGASDPPASPLPLPTMEMDISDEDDPSMPASQMAAALEEIEEGSVMESPTAADFPLSSARLNPTPPLVPPASEREGLATLEDEEDEETVPPAAQSPLPNARIEMLDAPVPDTALFLLGELERQEVDHMPPVPAAQTAEAYEKMEHALRDFPGLLPVMPPVPADQTAAAYEEMEKNIRSSIMDSPSPSMPPMLAALTGAKFQEDGEQKLAAVAHDTVGQTLSTPVAPVPDEMPSPPAEDPQEDAGRTRPSVVLPRRPPPRSMLPSPNNDDDVADTQSVGTLQVVEATLYEQDSVVYLGTPVESDLRPWWKKHRMPIAIAVSGLVAGSAVALGATLSSSREPVIATSRPSETLTFLPSLGPSKSSPPSEIPSLQPTFHPSQSVAPTSVRSAPPSASLVPSTSPSSSPSAPPSASALPTAFCFEGTINIFTDSHPEDTSWTLSRITTEEGVPTANVVREGSPEDESSLHTYEVCLERGEYEFTIYDRFGDGMCCDNGAGHFELELDGWVVLEGGEFGSSQTVSFSLPAASLPPSRSSVPSRSLSPSLRPSTSLGPSSQVPSLVPTLSLRPSALPSLLPTAPPSTYWSSLIWEQKGQTINGESPGDHSGRSVVLSGDGMTMAVGSPGAADNFNRPGYVKVYHKEDNASSWQDVGHKIEGTANGNRFGESLAFSEDGRTLAIGAPGLSFIPGYVRVYQMEEDGPGSSWKQLGQDITREGGGDRFGVSIALSANGRTLAIGDLVACDAAGLVRIYGWDEDGSSWKQLGQDLKGEASLDFSGFSVDLSSDGMTVAIGAWGNNGNGLDSGHVRVYLRKGDGLSWEQLGQDIEGEAPGAQSGFSVSLSADGRMIAIGALFNDGNVDDAGHTRVYRIDDAGPSWEQIGQDIDGEAAGDRFGSSLSLSADGKTVAIGAHANDGNGPFSGHVKVYRMEDGPEWIQVGRDIDGGTIGDNAGWAVSLSADGRTVAVGSPSAGVDWGHVRVFNVNY